MLKRIRNSRVRVFLPLLLVFTLVLGGCSADGEVTIDLDGDGNGQTEVQAEGFLNGLLDGFIAPFTALVSLFGDDVDVYASGSGRWYAVGFVLGLLLIISILLGLFTGRRWYRRRG